MGLTERLPSREVPYRRLGGQTDAAIAAGNHGDFPGEFPGIRIHEFYIVWYVCNPWTTVVKWFMYR
jgi:hypothetical protein